MTPIITHHWHPASHAGLWHHYIVTRLRACVSHVDNHSGRCQYSDQIRVAYSCTKSDGRPITTIVDEEADSKARWNLPPDAASAWVAQRAHGWNGTNENYQHPPIGGTHV
jgi:hypothetical protein